MKSFVFSANVFEKLRDKHDVTTREIEQCFENKTGLYCIDEREDHQSDPPTLWFVAPTNRNRLLKVIFMFVDGNIHIKSAFEPEQAAIDLYEKIGK